MFKNLFVKYVSAFMVIIVASFAILSAVVISLVDSYADREKLSSLRNIAGAAAVYASHDYDRHFVKEHDILIDTYDGDFKAAVDIIASSRKCSLFAVGEGGDVRAVGAPGETDGKSVFASDPKEASVPEEYISEIFENGYISGEGRLGGVFSSDCMYAGVGLDSGDGKRGAVFAATDDLEPDYIVDSMIKMMLMSGLWIILATFMAVYVISGRLAKPLKDMKKAADEFSKGNFKSRIDVRGDDEIAKLGRSFNSMADSLENLESMRSSFISSISHELRTPMTTIGGFVDSILVGAIPPEEERQYLELISSEINRLSRLISSLLQISRLESGKAKLTLAPFDICEMARMILISNEQRINEKNLDVEFECDEDNISVIADKDFIYQVMFNICDNAIKFSRPCGKYKITVHKISGKRVEVSVYNEGVGIKPEDLPYVFDRFYKSDKSRGLDKTGVGLGLYIVKCVINNHGQDIKAESEYGKWCRFTFTLALK